MENQNNQQPAKGMKIIELQAENFKKLKVVRVAPAGNIVQISGDNEQGKSSIIDAIWAAFDFASMKRESRLSLPVHAGAEEGFIKVTLDDLIITRTFTNEGSTVTVENAEGAKYGSPQKILDGLLGKVAIDPFSFSTMDDKKQRETLLKIIDLKIDLEKTKAFRKGAFDKRTDLNREIKMLESQLMGIDEIPDNTPDVEQSAATVMDEINQAQKTLNENDRIRRRLVENQNETEKIRKEIARVEDILADLKTKLDAAGLEHIDLSEKADALIDPDMSTFKMRLAQIEEINNNVRTKKAMEAVCKQLDNLRNQVIVQESKIAAIDKEKLDALNAAKFPIDGLSVSDDGVTYKGIPFSQCSSGERLRVSIAIAMAMSPRLRVIRITDGSLVGPTNMALIAEMAAKNDYQIWIEKVDTSGKIGIYIEDGEVKAIN